MKSRLVNFTLIFHLILLLCVGNGSSALAQETVAAPDFAAIDAFVGAQVKERNLPGLALGIVRGDEIVHLQGFGIADPSGRAITPQTPFRLASLTKSFTALAIMQLVETRQLELDAPVQQYLPWFRVADAGDSARITMRHLLHQTSGLSTNAGLHSIATPNTDEFDAEDYVRDLSKVNLAHPVGEAHEYSNANYITLGVIIETVSRQPYAQYIQEHIFEPLDMHNTFVTQQTAQQHGMATGYQPFLGIFMPFEFTFPQSNLAAGGIISSAEDMTHYLILYLNQGHYGDGSLLSSAGLDELWQQPAYLLGEQHVSYAMGWFVDSKFSSRVLHHWGNIVNFSSYMAVAPDDGWGVVVLANADHPALVSPIVIETIGPGVLSMLLGEPSVGSDNIVPQIYWGTFLIVALQCVTLLWSVSRLRRWSLNSERHPQSVRQVGLRIVLPILLNVLVAYVFMISLPQVAGTTLGITLQINPDWGIGFLMSGILAAGWLIWGIAALVVLRKQPAPAVMPERLMTETIR